jgi:hypothetical protein
MVIVFLILLIMILLILIAIYITLKKQLDSNKEIEYAIYRLIEITKEKR